MRMENGNSGLNKPGRNTLFACVLMILLVPCHGQENSKSDLERQRREIQESINNTTRLLEQAASSRRTNLESLNVINRRLQLRNDLIRTIESEIRLIDNSISRGNDRVKQLEKELGEAKEAYGRLIIMAHRHRMSHQKLMFVLAADDFNQAYRRFKYLQQYGRSRQRQIDQINNLREEIYREVAILESQKLDKNNLLQMNRNELTALNNEKRQQSSIVEQLGRRENQLKQELTRQQREAKALQDAIERLLREEAETAKATRTFELAPADKIISDQFIQNKGGLPWPIERGVVTGFFGEHPHPVLRGIKVQNNGIDISTVENAEVRAVFNGTVRQVLTVPGSNNVVIVRHGNFLTVYANLAHVYVRTGDSVTTKQLIGRVFTDNDDNQTVLHLEIWEENKKLDPMVWLSRQ
jgi:murein hydrolase activator